MSPSRMHDLSPIRRTSTYTQATQARLMKRRGDLAKKSFTFNASLPAPRPNAHGLGMDVVVSDNSWSLVVADVDSDPSFSTPVAEWNMREDRQAHRGVDEERASLAIKPGDKIYAVNGLHGDDMAMAEMLTSAADLDSPKAINLTLERSRSDVLGPQDVILPPKLPTSGTRPSIFKNTRSNSNPDAQYLSSRPSSEKTTSLPQWNSMLSSQKSMDDGASIRSQKLRLPRWSACEDEASTREPSVSGRSSSASSSENGLPIIIKGKNMDKSFRNFARIGRARFSN